MSAYVVDDDHINALLTWAISERIHLWDETEKQSFPVTAESAESFGQILMAENVRSVNYRYNETDEDDLTAYAFKPFPVLLTPKEVIRACGCLEYQSCETGDWQGTAAARILFQLVNVAADILAKDCDVWSIRADTVLANSPVKRERKRV